jgi:hypothetical protein
MEEEDPVLGVGMDVGVRLEAGAAGAGVGAGVGVGVGMVEVGLEGVCVEGPVMFSPDNIGLAGEGGLNEEKQYKKKLELLSIRCGSIAIDPWSLPCTYLLSRLNPHLSRSSFLLLFLDLQLLQEDLHLHFAGSICPIS